MYFDIMRGFGQCGMCGYVRLSNNMEFVPNQLRTKILTFSSQFHNNRDGIEVVQNIT